MAAILRLRHYIPLARRILCCLVASLCASCGGSSERPTQLPASPQSVLVDLSDAIRRNDVAAFSALFDGSPDEKAVLRAMGELMAATRYFRSKFIDAYGQAAWDRFKDPAGEGAFFNPITGQELDAMLDADMVVESGHTVARWEGEFADGELTLVKHKSGWLISAASALPPEYDPKMVDVFTRSAQTVSKYTQAIGYEGITADDLDVGLGHAILTEALGFQLEHGSRFDIDQVIRAKADSTVNSE